MDLPEVVKLLTEIRDLQQEQMENAKRVGEESLQLTRLAVLRQKRTMIVAAVTFGGLIIFLLFTAWQFSLLLQTAEAPLAQDTVLEHK